MTRETMNIVIVGHVDHGKSTLVGRLLADTDSLGDGKLEKVQETCRRQGKAFEYAFLLDALEEEQGQGITIDAARVFFKTARRDYIIIDAPGHIEFLKNMVTGAARAEAAILLIDAKEGVRENSRRHGYMLSMLGIRQVIVAVNKIDLVDYDERRFIEITREYRAFLNEIDVSPLHFIPVSAKNGDQIAVRSENLAWFDGPTILHAVDKLGKRATDSKLPLRMPVQDVYKFNEEADDRRIVAGRVEAGTLHVGDTVLFSPSNKRSQVASIEAFSACPQTAATAGQSTGITLTEQIYVSRGEVLSRLESAPSVSTKLRANLFWLGRRPMEPGRRYKLKLGTAETEVGIESIIRVLDASDLGTTTTKQRVDRHDVAEVILRARSPIAFDASEQIEATGRFVIVDGFDIAGGGIVRAKIADELDTRRLGSKIRDLEWVRGDVMPSTRALRNGHPASMIMLTGDSGSGKHAIARELERQLADAGHQAYLLDGKNVFLGVDADIAFDDVEELVRRYGEVLHILLDAGLLVVSTTNVICLADHRVLQTLIAPVPMFVVQVGPLPAISSNGADLHVEANTTPKQATEQIHTALAALGRLRRP